MFPTCLPFSLSVSVQKSSLNWITAVGFLDICLLFIQIRVICQRAFQWTQSFQKNGNESLIQGVTEKHLITCKWVCGLCAAAYHHVPIPPGTGFPLFPFPVSPLTPTVNTNCERGTQNNKACQCHCWYSTMYSLQKRIYFKTHRKSDCKLFLSAEQVLSTAVSFQVSMKYKSKEIGCNKAKTCPWNHKHIHL